MAIDPRRRENLLSEATAYARRALFRVPCSAAWLTAISTEQPTGFCVPNSELASLAGEVFRDWMRPLAKQSEWELFVGMRGDGGWALYFEEQPVLQFNGADELRRLFASDQRYAAEHGRLKLLDRLTRGGQVQLREVALDETRHQRVLAACRCFVAMAYEAFETGGVKLLGQVPSDDSAWLIQMPQRLRKVADGLLDAPTAHAAKW